MRFIKIKGVLVNLETVTKIERHYYEIWVEYVSGDRSEHEFSGEMAAAEEFERLEKLICATQ